MNLIFDRVLDRPALEGILTKNGAQIAGQGAGQVVYRFASGARAEVTAAARQYRLRVLAPPGCACMK